MYSMFLEIKLIQIKTLHVHIQILQWWCTPLSLKAGMESLKRRLSFRKKKNHVPECSKPHQWQEDEKKVRDGTCSFQVRVKNMTDTSLNYCSVKQNNLRMSLYFIECTLHVWFYPQCHKPSILQSIQKFIVWVCSVYHQRWCILKHTYPTDTYIYWSILVY